MKPEQQTAKILDAGLDMLDALESLVLYVSEIHPDELELDVWKQANAAIRKAGGDTFAYLSSKESDDQCHVCGDHHDDAVPFGCQTGDGV